MLIKLSLLLLGWQSHALGWGAQAVRPLWHKVAVVEDQRLLLPLILLLGVTVRRPSGSPYAYAVNWGRIHEMRVFCST